MDPADHTASLTMDVLDPIYESLTRFDQNLEVSPSLATKWSVDSSGTKWTLELRKGVHFHDGTPFDAQAVVDSFNRLLDPDRGLAAASRVRSIVKRVTAYRARHGAFHARNSYASFPRVLAVTPIVSPAADRDGEALASGCRYRALQVRGVEDRRIRSGRAKRAILGPSSGGKAAEMDLDQRAGADEYVGPGG